MVGRGAQMGRVRDSFRHSQGICPKILDLEGKLSYTHNCLLEKTFPSFGRWGRYRGRAEMRCLIVSRCTGTFFFCWLCIKFFSF
jgi:hypothetical protein